MSGAGLTSLEQSDPEPVQIPVLSVRVADAARLATAAAGGSVTVHLSHAPELRGADAQGRVLMNATSPATTSSLSHWDVLARPNLLMEPFETPHTEHGVDLARALLVDIGWTPFCGNGRIDQEEGCDDAQDNSDSAPDACRTDCTTARCGDGVQDRGEVCGDAEDAAGAGEARRDDDGGCGCRVLGADARAGRNRPAPWLLACALCVLIGRKLRWCR